MSDSDKKDPGYEKLDVNLTKVAIWGISGIILLVIILAFLWQYFIITKNEYYFEAVDKPRSQELLNLREHENDVLNNYKLLDKEKGIYRIPIDEAMKLTVEEAAKGAKR